MRLALLVWLSVVLVCTVAIVPVYAAVTAPLSSSSSATVVAPPGARVGPPLCC